ncbi:MAG TPA: hypothetical protein VE173_05165, partial [Longimicrobiales bacterium]|nr:hypothetical protein [Longimicrobiales bacterium]
QFRRAFAGTVDRHPERWGFQGWRIARTLELVPDDARPFPVNRDGSTYLCRGMARFRIVGQVRLMSRVGGATPS